MRIFATNESIEVYARVGGRPLGLAFDKDRNLIVCEPLKGILLLLYTLSLYLFLVHFSFIYFISLAAFSPLFIIIVINVI